MAINDYLPSSDNKIVNAGASILKNEFNLEKDLEIIVYDQFRDGLIFKPFLTYLNLIVERQCFCELKNC